MKPLMTSTALVAAITMTAVPVHADATVCMEMGELRGALTDWYQERPAGEPVETGSSALQVWASADQGTWTIVRIYDETNGCVVAQGGQAEPTPAVPMHLAAGS